MSLEGLHMAERDMLREHICCYMRDLGVIKQNQAAVLRKSLII